MRARSRIVIGALASAVLALTACGRSFDDPESARCTTPQAAFGDAVDLSGHLEVPVHFTCEGATLAGALYLPTGTGPHPAIVWVHGAGEATRIPYRFPVFTSLVQAGVAVFTYDKRGAGESEGECCPGDHGHFYLLTADVVGAVASLQSRSDIDPKQIGLIGASQVGWIVPRAAVESGVAFTALASAAILPYGQVKAYVNLTGGDGSDRPFPSREQIAGRLRDSRPSGFDPRPYVKRMTMPALWLYGSADKEVPVEQCVSLLEELQGQGRDFTVVEFSHAGHGLLDTPPTDPRAPLTLIKWVLEHVKLSGS